MVIPRFIASRAQVLAKQFPALVITGARQSGKTTLIDLAFPGLRLVNLDLPSLAEQAEREPATFFSSYQPPVAIDEVQRAPGVFRHIKASIDGDRHTMGRFVLSGSQAFNLMKGASDSLAGRCAILELENLSAAELVAAGAIESAAAARSRLMSRGQFPELWRDPTISARDFHSSYVATYLERDVRQLLNVTSLRDFERFIRVLASRSGSILNKSDVAKDVGVSAKAIGDWLSVLEASGQIILLEPWFSSFGKRIVKSPKLYFRDTGLLCFLLGLDESSMALSPFLGALWETYIFAEMRKLEAAKGGGSRFWFYRDQRGREIDFVVERGGTLSFVEAKWSERPDASDAAVISTIDAELRISGSPWRPGRHYVVSLAAASYPISEGVEAVDEAAIAGILGP